MAQKISRGKRKELGITLKAREGLWISYQLRVAGLTQSDIAAKVGVSGALVGQFLKGKKNSERTKVGIVVALGYSSWEKLHSSARRATRENVIA